MRPNGSPIWVQLLTACAFTLALLILLGVTLVRPKARVMGYPLAVLIFLSLLSAFRGDTAYAAPGSQFPETPFIAALRQTGARISGSNDLRNWPLAGNLVPQSYSPSGVLTKRQGAFLIQTATEPLLIRGAGSPSLLLTKRDIQGPFAMLRPMLAIQHVFPSGAVVFKDLGAKPRAWIDYDERATQKDLAALMPSAPTVAPSSAGQSPEQVAITTPEVNDGVQIQVEQTRPGVLVLTDTYYPGWKARVNGKPAPVLPMYGVFRGVQLSEGKHTVEFYYAPESVQLGLVISILAAAIVAILLGRIVLEVVAKRRAPAH
jgi:hypothetical protein